VLSSSTPVRSRHGSWSSRSPSFRLRRRCSPRRS
jgi:hypothetical protein